MTSEPHKVAFYAELLTHQVTIGSTLISSNPRAGDGPQIINPDFLESYVVEL